MKAPIKFFAFIVIVLFVSCSKDSQEDSPEIILETGELYFPPIGSNDWEATTLSELNWNTSAEQDLYDFLEEKETDAFLVLKGGKIVIEKYFGDFTHTSPHTWNSAGKTITAMTTGIAQQEGFLSLSDSPLDYLGNTWSMLTPEQEQQITVEHHLTMTTGLDYTLGDVNCTDKECLTYKNNPGDFWFYHNAPYTLLDQIITNAVGKDFEAYFTEKIKNPIGMTGSWISVGYNNVYFSTARSMARFGLLNLNNGVWDGQTILDDPNFNEAMKTTSQEHNRAYGYLWWLNGKESYRVPGGEILFQGKLIENAPDDLIAGLGKNDQKLHIVPSLGLVVVRMGGDAGETLLGPSSFDNELWERINALIN
ncbi:serine hydrolase domain-containing protein [Maribacter sp. 2308TA10-17]|uniref:serine hydrolase domain-containing protein n=1 Tax=Maribacter sp. 2308TA10-17 TaxID=3386276 RepID=UPI0039BCFC49